MIQITRLLAKQLRSIVRRTFHRQANTLTFRSGDDGLFIEVQGGNQALQFHDPQPQDRELLLIPQNVLDDVQGTKVDPVFLNMRRAGVIGASWHDKGVFHDLEYDAAEPVADAPAFPAIPASFAENPPALLVALRHAYETTDFESKRYALGCIQLRGKEGVVAATDGLQMLKQSGFQFGFDDELLVQHTKFFSNKDLPADQPVRIGKRDEQVAFQIGPWTYWLEIQKEGRFPDIDRIIPSTQCSKATLQLTPADARFLLDNLQRLPNGDTHRELTLDLNGKVILRASSASTPRPAELILRNSSKQGEDVRICTDRTFLARAAEMGFTEIHLPDNVSPAVARDATRTFLWMLLDPKDAIKPTDDCLRIESPLSFNNRVSSPTTSRKTTPVKQIASSPPPDSSSPAPTPLSPAQTARRPRRSDSLEKKPTSSLELAISLRDQLRQALVGSKELIHTLQTERRSEKSLKLALASLKQLQNVA